MRVAAHGLVVDTPTGWDARIYRRPQTDHGEDNHPVLHAANFPLPAERGDYGSGAVDRMRGDDVLVVLIEFGTDSAGSALFSRRGLPRPRARDFDPRMLQRTLPGQSGCQSFFTHGNRAFCLYVVLGDHARRVRLVPRVHELLDRLAIA